MVIVVLLFDPRLDIKDTVNEIKRRQKFRPLCSNNLRGIELTNILKVSNESLYIQFVIKPKHDYKSVTHVDGTTRVQIVEKK